MVVKWIRTILGSSRKFIGDDYLGNKYYEYMKVSGQVQRTVENNVKPEDFTSGEIPQQWEAWLRGRRSQPPSGQELQRGLDYTTAVLKRAAIKKKEDDRKQAKAFADGLIAKERPNDDSLLGSKGVSTSKTKDDAFKPDAKLKKQSTKYEPEAWTPGSKT